MGALIDSSVLVAVERGDLGLDRALEGYEEEDLAISVVTASELMHSVYGAGDEALRSLREAWVETLLSSVPVVAFNLVAARIHARLSAALAAEGTAVGANDMIIAATALGRGLDVVTRDERSFRRIPGLQVVFW